ncbi:Cell division cycle protein 123 [Talaromyces atroroseus]|uniref:Cell division cycle protein 123 n=1 Tax=Talaromyces atroroseus TaxID=1441469 RepID=A0A1Q5Q9S7_TALAT|nr:Cell division cycle protein 123 [Talaromyces atroroseus]OKL62693.1 Cell division cycle protein 123 [Talaromyces atroroseus]
MPHSDSDTVEAEAPLTRLPFPPVTRSQILHCSYHFWHPLYRALTPKARLIPLSDPFLSYLRADGIVLPPEHPSRSHITDDDSGIEASDSEDEEEDDDDPSAAWQDIHIQIEDTIRELDGKVTPKLNWSAPKDATWIAVTNDLQCQTPNDIYMLLKSSDFITHDLEHAFDDTEPDQSVPTTQENTNTDSIPYYLVLRKYFNLNPSLEFRCFVRNRTLLCMCQRDLNHFDFLFPMREMLVSRIQTFFDERLKDTFPDPNFVFDVYIPPPHDRVWLIDINPWAVRTDPLLFSWLEILTMKDLAPLEDEVVRLSIKDDGPSAAKPETEPFDNSMAEDDEEEDEDIENVSSLPELRLVGRDDPEAYGFTTPQYSAHKLPRDVVDASRAGPGGMESFMRQWKDLLAQEFQQQQAESSDDE